MEESSGNVYLPYVVRQGDYLSKLAFRYGFDPQTVWKHAKNRRLRDERPNPEILCPGDLIFFPRKSAPKLPFRAGQENRYICTIHKVKVELTLLNPPGDDSGGHILAGKKYVVEGLGKPLEGTIGGDGKVSFEVPITLNMVTLVVEEEGLSYHINIGHMDPETEQSGVRQRLSQLGYFDEIADMDFNLTPAIIAFQKDNGIDPATGVLDDQTRAKLVERHGS